MRIQKRGKRAQITIFIIIGIVLLVGLAVTVIVLTKKAPVENKNVDISTVKANLQTCFDGSVKSGLKAIGQHGGYISVKDPSITHEFFKPSFQPTDGDYVSIGVDPSTNVDVPYWHYLKSSNDCTGYCVFSSMKPSLKGSDTSIQKQLERFVLSDSRACVTNVLNKAKDEFDIKSTGTLTVSADIGQNDVVFTIDMPLKLTKDGASTNLEPIVIRKRVPLGKMYDLASNLSASEKQYCYLERQARDLITSFSGTSKDRLPPAAGLTFEYGSNVYWMKSDVKENVQNLLGNYVPLFYLEPRDIKKYTFPDIADPDIRASTEAIFNKARVPLNDNGFDVNFNYQPWWNPYFDLNCDGELCRPFSYTNTLGFLFGFQQYRTYYDISYPVVVTIVDDKSDCCSDEGYRFQFAMESNLRGTDCMTEDYTYVAAPTFEKGSEFCNPELRTVPVKFNVTDAVTHKGVPEALVTLKAAGEDCFIGVTDRDGKLDALMPSAAIGRVQVMNTDYASGNADISIPGTDKLNVVLEPYADVDVSIKRVLLSKSLSTGAWDVKSRLPPSDLESKESAVITFERVKDNPLDDDVIAATELSSKTKKDTLRLVPGKYTVNVNIINTQAIYIYPDLRCSSGGGFLGFGESEYCFRIPEQRMDLEEFIAGGLVLDNTSGYLELDRGDLNKGGIELRAIGIDYIAVPSTGANPQLKVEDLNQMSNIGEYSRRYRHGALEPVIRTK